MASVFHWIKVKAICYATEDEDLLCDVMSNLTGVEELDIDISEGLHNNPLIVIDVNLSKNKEYVRLFENLGSTVIERILDGIESRVDDDCLMYVRLDKQRAVCGEYEICHGGDVISITAKIMAFPARKDVAIKCVSNYLSNLGPVDEK